MSTIEIVSIFVLIDWPLSKLYITIHPVLLPSENRLCGKPSKRFLVRIRAWQRFYEKWKSIDCPVGFCHLAACLFQSKMSNI